MLRWLATARSLCAQASIMSPTSATGHRHSTASGLIFNKVRRARSRRLPRSTSNVGKGRRHPGAALPLTTRRSGAIPKPSGAVGFTLPPAAAEQSAWALTGQQPSASLMADFGGSGCFRHRIEKACVGRALPGANAGSGTFRSLHMLPAIDSFPQNQTFPAESRPRPNMSKAGRLRNGGFGTEILK